MATRKKGFKAFSKFLFVGIIFLALILGVILVQTKTRFLPFASQTESVPSCAYAQSWAGWGGAPLDIGYASTIDRMFVADGYYNERAVKFTLQGVKEGEWGTVISPQNMAIDNQNQKIYISQFSVYPDGSLVKKFNFSGSVEATWQATQVSSVAVAPSGYIYTGSPVQIIEKWDSSGNLLGSWSCRDQSGSGLAPTEIAFDSAGNMYVGAGYHATRRLIKYAPPVVGQNLTILAQTADGVVESEVNGIAFNEAQGWVFITDRGNDELKALNLSNLALLLEWGGHGSGPGQFNDIRGIAIDPIGNLYIADQDNGRIQKFVCVGPTPTPTIFLTPTPRPTQVPCGGLCIELTECQKRGGTCVSGYKCPIMPNPCCCRLPRATPIP